MQTPTAKEIQALREAQELLARLDQQGQAVAATEIIQSGVLPDGQSQPRGFWKRMSDR